MARVSLTYFCTLLFCLGLLVVPGLSIEPPQPKRKRASPPDEPTRHDAPPDRFQTEQDASFSRASQIPNNFGQKGVAECLPCAASKRNTLQLAVEAFWRNDFLSAYGCACNHLLSKPEDGFAQSIVYALSQAKLAYLNIGSKAVSPLNPAPPMRKWEILGPINVGKLEHDADSTFQIGDSQAANDPALHILCMYSNATVYSDIANGGTVKWTSTTASEQGEVDVRFPGTKWNELIQGLSTMAAYEFLAWARTVTYVKAPGSYMISCAGPHTVYVRNDNNTRVLVGDVYRSGKSSAAIDLRVGLVGLAIPLRGMGQTSFRCTLEPAPDTIAVFHPDQVPDLLEFPEVSERGYLLSSVFSLSIQNQQNVPLSIEFLVEKPLGQSGEFFVRVAKPLVDSDGSHPHTGVEEGFSGANSIAPGQTIHLPLELLPLVQKAGPPSLPFLSCRKNKPFLISVIPSRGATVKVPLEFKCRKLDQSFLVSYLDHDSSVAQAAVVFPLEYHNADIRRAALLDTHPVSWDGSVDEADHAAGSQSDEPQNVTTSYPVLLTMHGSGIPASNHADAHKMVPNGKTDYIFGVKGFITVAPSRFGAHNWELTGELSARHALRSVQLILRKTMHLKFVSKAGAKATTARTVLPLPQLRLGSGLVSGHSMGAHGAWMLALNSPDLFTCLASLSGWVNKEEYGTANAFFHLDSSSSYVDPQLKEILQSAMSDTHADKLMHNVQGMDVHIRVGSADATTHPWYSRRMHRLLQNIGVNSTFEEVADKEHWWWDTHQANDGGVLNDPRMRAFYEHCRLKSVQESQHQQAARQDTADVVSVELKIDQKIEKPAPSSADSLSTRHKRPCARNVTLTVLNPATHAGKCGLQVQQQRRMLSRTVAQLHCSEVTVQPARGSSSVATKRKICRMATQNMQKLSISFGGEFALQGDELLTIDGVDFDLSKVKPHVALTDKLEYCALPGSCSAAQADGGVDGNAGALAALADSNLDFCWAASSAESRVAPCPLPAAPEVTGIAVKSLVNYGPVRQVFARPFHIVYGTPSNQALRLALRDLAVYLGNSHAAAYHTHVRVMSDLEYQASNYAKHAELANIIFVGGPGMNKLMNFICGDGTKALEIPKDGLPLTCRLPTGVKFSTGANGNSDSAADGGQYRFELDSTVFSNADHAAIFTLPFSRPAPLFAAGSTSNRASAAHTAASTTTSAVAMAVCIHANSARGYLHLSRLAWPVVPPMVRAPFSTYIPDYVVIDERLWALGMGAVLKAGYWDNDWKPAEGQAYSNVFID